MRTMACSAADALAAAALLLVQPPYPYFLRYNPVQSCTPAVAGQSAGVPDELAAAAIWLAPQSRPYILCLAPHRHAPQLNPASRKPSRRLADAWAAVPLQLVQQARP